MNASSSRAWPASAQSAWVHRFVWLVVLLAISAGCKRTARKKPSGRPSVILISVDTLRADHLGTYGYFRDTSPNIDAFAKEALVFENAIAPMATTLPSHVSLFTATNPAKHGLKANFDVYRQRLDSNGQLQTMAEILKSNGFATAGFVSATPMKTHTGIQAGFDTYVQPADDEASVLAGGTVRRVVKWLASTPAEPFFLFVHLFDPHLPYDQPDEFRDIFRSGEDLFNVMRARRVTPKIRDADVRINLYDGEIRYVDTQLGLLFEELRERDLFDDSLIVFLGDHGEGLGQHDWWSHGLIYEEQVRVPLIVKQPAAKRAVGRRAELVGLIDLLPSVLATLSIEPTAAQRDQFEGADVLTRRSSRDAVLVERVDRCRPGWAPCGKNVALREARWKLMHFAGGPDALYDLKQDPYEHRDVSSGNAIELERMRAKLAELLSAYDEPQAGTQPAAEVPASVKEQLEALGYVQ